MHTSRYGAFVQNIIVEYSTPYVGISSLIILKFL